MTPDLNQIDFYKVLFWIIIVLVAGFIGQFGKSFAKYIMERFGKKPPRTAEPQRPPQVEGGPKKDIPPPPIAAPSAESALPAEEGKIRKKELKAELKRRKKEDK
jgi:hypothetical protein